MIEMWLQPPLCFLTKNWGGLIMAHVYQTMSQIIVEMIPFFFLETYRCNLSYDHIFWINKRCWTKAEAFFKSEKVQNTTILDPKYQKIVILEESNQNSAFHFPSQRWSHLSKVLRGKRERKNIQNFKKRICYYF